MRAWRFVAVIYCLILAGCSSDGSSFMDDIEFGLPGLGEGVYMGEDNKTLEVPPDLTSLDASKKLGVPGSENISMSDMAFDSYVLPERLDLRIHREGDVTWLAVDVDPLSLWPELQNFLRRSGFEIIASDPTAGNIETNWRERQLNVDHKRESLIRVRNQLRVNLEREPNAITNVFFSVREAGYAGGGWRMLPPDPYLEKLLLSKFKDYLAFNREIANPQMASLDDIKTLLRIRNAQGVAMLEIGQSFSKAWRRLNTALRRSGINVRASDRSRGIYLIEYRATPSEQRDAIDNVVVNRTLIQLHVLGSANRTIVTVHANRDGKKVPYAFAQRVLQRVVMAYQPTLGS